MITTSKFHHPLYFLCDESHMLMSFVFYWLQFDQKSKECVCILELETRSSVQQQKSRYFCTFAVIVNTWRNWEFPNYSCTLYSANFYVNEHSEFFSYISIRLVCTCIICVFTNIHCNLRLLCMFIKYNKHKLKIQFRNTKYKHTHNVKNERDR
jgi:hypothetical protein